MLLSKARKANRESRCIILLTSNSALYWSEWSATHPGFPVPKKELRYPLDRRVGEPKSRSGQFGVKISCPGRYSNRGPSSPWPSRYINCNYYVRRYLNFGPFRSLHHRQRNVVDRHWVYRSLCSFRFLGICKTPIQVFGKGIDTKQQMIWTCFKSRAVPACAKRCCYKELVISSHRDLGASRTFNSHKKHRLFLYTINKESKETDYLCSRNLNFCINSCII